VNTWDSDIAKAPVTIPQILPLTFTPGPTTEGVDLVNETNFGDSNSLDGSKGPKIESEPRKPGRPLSTSLKREEERGRPGAMIVDNLSVPGKLKTL
jgi:hypothetical protein